MKRYGVIDALTTDEHFQQAGFRALLREDAMIDSAPGIDDGAVS